MLFVCDGDRSETALVNVTRCTDMKLKNVERFLHRKTKWPFEVMLKGMQEHYRTIKMHDLVQVVEHEPRIESPV